MTPQHNEVSEKYLLPSLILMNQVGHQTKMY